MSGQTPPPAGRAPRASLSAELALGVLDPAEQASAEARAAADPAFAAEAAAWAARLHPLTEEAPPLQPSAELWARIEAGLPAAAPVLASASSSAPAPAAPVSRGEVVALAPRRALRVWQAIAGVSALAAAASVTLLVLVGGPKVVAAPLLAARLDPPASAGLLSNSPLFTATLDPGRSAVVIAPVNPGPVDPRVRELWIIPKDHKPLAAGVIDTGRTAPLKLSRDLLAAAEAGATLAVTLEPAPVPAGGPPTGPVIASGVLARV